MSTTLRPDKIAEIETKAVLHFGPVLLEEALKRLCRSETAACLDSYEKHMVDRLEAMAGDDPDFELMKEYAIQRLYTIVKEVRSNPDTRQPPEDTQTRRTAGRSENPDTLEEQLQHGLEDTFPASDPPAVVSTAISGGGKKLEGVEEVLRRKREAQTKKAG
ncbi:hypothetical protein [Kumtagia ephedrae]|jgi:Tfp pilus assembly PilM family ATPase|uniref:Uncharacterized protein n=1 Tax=Kumtagia ephedrae TaxID=2116701 RepID=A0A2P7RXK9_9HYPH|nr:hypothetical protein [Mesorhizobium ephedrae]PSJ54965.1 hypothetical protein C7I84_23475 [Mesorhizobium ephedrae]